MNTALWVIQVVLALVFLITGSLKLMLPMEKIALLLGPEHGLSSSVVRLIGLLEVLGALGMVLPAWTGFLPWLTPLAAAGLMLTMVGATFENARHKYYSKIAVNVVLALLAVFVIYGRALAVSA